MCDMHYYKTSLCKTWVRLRKCPYLGNCMFAHGIEDLLQPGEYQQIQKTQNTKKRNQRRKRKISESSNSNESDKSESSNSNESESSNSNESDKPQDSIKSPLNAPFTQQISNDYDEYWEIIHKMIILESNHIQYQKQKQQQQQQRQQLYFPSYLLPQFFRPIPIINYDCNRSSNLYA